MSQLHLERTTATHSTWGATLEECLESAVVQKAAARLLVGASYQDHVTPILKQLILASSAPKPNSRCCF